MPGGDCDTTRRSSSDSTRRRLPCTSCSPVRTSESCWCTALTTRSQLTPDELLSTTRAVRRRLDLTRPVERSVIEDCLRLAQQAPSGSNAQKWHFVIVMDREKRAALGNLWREGGERYLAAAEAEPGPSQNERLLGSVRHLVE